MNIKLSKEQKKAEVGDAESIAVIMQQILKRENRLSRAREHFWVVGLNNINKILFIELIGLGQQNRVNANPPDVFRTAVYKLAVKLIMVHNHPSGSLKPSTADRAFTDRILKVGEILSIDVVDHLIIAESDYLSFGAEGIMDELKASNTWRITAVEDEEIRKMKDEVLRFEGEQKAKREMVSRLKAKGMSEAEIKEITGLRLSEIRKL